MTAAVRAAAPERLRVALVTGGSQGIGASMARHLLHAGIGVIGTYNRNKKGADAIIAAAAAIGGRAAVLPLDAGDDGAYGAFAEAVAAVLPEFGVERLDYLVNNAGVSTHALFADTSQDQFDDLIRVNLKSPFFLTQALLPLIADGGRILNVSSGLTRSTLPGQSVYAATKAALEVLTRYQAKELGERGIRVNVIVPGAVATSFAGGAIRDDENLRARLVASIPLGRVGEADDIGAAVPALLSDGFGWANGARIDLTGGELL